MLKELKLALLFVFISQYACLPATDICAGKQSSPFQDRIISLGDKTTFTTFTQTNCVEYYKLTLDDSFENDYLMFELRFRNFPNNPKFTPWLVEREKSRPVIISLGDQGNNYDTSDLNGFYNRKTYHNIPIDFTNDEITDPIDLYFAVYKFFTNPADYVDATIEYDIYVWGSDTFPCPQGCLNDGLCDTDVKMCACKPVWFDLDCSVLATEIAVGQASHHIVQPYSWSYLFWKIGGYSQDLELIFEKNKLKANYVFLFQDTYYSNLPNSYVDNGKYNVIASQVQGNLLIQENSMQDHQNEVLVIGVYNNNSMPLESTIRLKKYVSESLLRTISTYTLAGMAGALTLMWLITTAVNHKHHNRMEALIRSFRAQRTEEQSLSKKDVNKYFPKKKYRELKDLYDQTTCSVCLEDFEVEANCRQLYCEHIYHADCIEVWLNHHYNCPNCKKDMTKKAIEDFYKAKNSPRGRKLNSQGTLDENIKVSRFVPNQVHVANANQNANIPEPADTLRHAASTMNDNIS